MNKNTRVAKIVIEKGFFYSYDENGNQLKLQRMHRVWLERYNYSSIESHEEFQNEVKMNLCNGHNLISNNFIFIKEGKTIYKN